MLSDNSKALVRQGYNEISYDYRVNCSTSRRPAIAASCRTWSHLKPGSRVLDLGCGYGVPVAQHLAGMYDVTGLDISKVQIERARALVPNARFLRADMTEADFPDGAFEAVVAFFAIIHVPVEEQRALFGRIARWLTDGSCLLATVGYTAWTGTEENWHGGTMYWSHTDAATYRAWLQDLGFAILSEQFIPEGDGGHALFLAQKPS